MRRCGTDLDTPSFDNRAALRILVCDDRGSQLTQQQDLEFGNEIHVAVGEQQQNVNHCSNTYWLSSDCSRCARFNAKAVV